MIFETLTQRLAARAADGLTRQRLTVQSAQQSYLEIAGERLLNFASNDYLGLANSDTAQTALAEAAHSYGFGSGASHLICGHQQPHQALETALAEFVGRDAALTFSCGYLANLAMLQSLAGKGDLIIADKLNHASLIDGARLSDAETRRYPHVDLNALQQRLKKAPQNKLVVTDSVFSMDGDIAPLKEIAALCSRYDALLLVDDAHGFGVLGEHGRGCTELFGLNQKQLPVLMGTLGKALGGSGAFIAGEKVLIDFLLQFARSYIYTTAMPAAVAAANLANLRLLQNSPQLRDRLNNNIEYFRRGCEKEGLALLPSTTAIQPLLVGDNERLLRISRMLKAQGILVGAIRPPTVPNNSARLRITLTAAHTNEQLDCLVAALKFTLDDLG